jgi:hypothetical protein
MEAKLRALGIAKTGKKTSKPTPMTLLILAMLLTMLLKHHYNRQ